MFEWVLFFFIFLIILILLIYNIIDHNEDKVLFYPSRRKNWKPEIEYKKVFINVKDPKDVVYFSRDRKNKCEYISGWHFDNFKNAKTIMFAHGNSGCINQRRYIIDMCHKFKLNLFVFDYRGYGSSDSHPNKIFLREDGELAYEYLHYACKIPNSKIIIWGESIGGVAAVHTASKYNCGGLILICSFSSLDDIAIYNLKGASRTAVEYLTSLLSFKMDMIPLKSHMKDVKCPVAIIHSYQDELVPYACSWINYHSVGHKNKMHVKIRGGHASPEIKSEQLRKVFNFFDMKLDNLSSNVDISEILTDLKTFAKRHNNFMSE